MIIAIILRTYIMQKSAKKHLRGVAINTYEEEKYKKKPEGGFYK